MPAPSSKVSNFEAGRRLYRDTFPPASQGFARPPQPHVPATLLIPRRPGEPRPGPNTPEGLAARQSAVRQSNPRLSISPPSASEHALARESVRTGRVIQSDSESMGSPSALGSPSAPMGSPSGSPGGFQSMGTPGVRGIGSPGSPMRVDNPSTPQRQTVPNTPLGSAERGSPRGLDDGSAGGMGRFHLSSTFSPSTETEVVENPDGGAIGPELLAALEYQDTSNWNGGYWIGNHWHGPGDAPRRRPDNWRGRGRGRGGSPGGTG
jgi:hypothetical protein